METPLRAPRPRARRRLPAPRASPATSTSSRVDAEDLADRPLPAGALRERPSALARADLVLCPRQRRRGRRCRRARRRARRCAGTAGSLGLLRRAEARRAAGPARAFLLAGIARPERFAADLDRPGRAAWPGAGLLPRPPSVHRRRSSQPAAAAAGAAGVGRGGDDGEGRGAACAAPGVTGPPALVVHRIEAEVEDEARSAGAPPPRGARGVSACARHALEARAGRRGRAASRGSPAARARPSPWAARSAAAWATSIRRHVADRGATTSPRLSRLGRGAPPRAPPAPCTRTSARCCSTSSGWPAARARRSSPSSTWRAREHVEAARAAGPRRRCS